MKTGMAHALSFSSCQMGKGNEEWRRERSPFVQLVELKWP